MDGTPGYSPPNVAGGERSDKRMTGASSARLPKLASRLYIGDMPTQPAASTSRVFFLINEKRHLRKPSSLRGKRISEKGRSKALAVAELRVLKVTFPKIGL
mgnify:CR=1 FL=1